MLPAFTIIFVIIWHQTPLLFIAVKTPELESQLESIPLPRLEFVRRWLHPVFNAGSEGCPAGWVLVPN